MFLWGGEGASNSHRQFPLDTIRAQPFTTERYHAMFPYSAPERFVEALEELARLELLERVGEGAYRLTDLGR
ncbi:MAG: hypothetical protein KKC18_15325, partial [Chloroflexi bacterium]|nr:hypothetical protein [Chloroflexota bacterium]